MNGRVELWWVWRVNLISSNIHGVDAHWRILTHCKVWGQLNFCHFCENLDLVRFLIICTWWGGNHRDSIHRTVAKLLVILNRQRSVESLAKKRLDVCDWGDPDWASLLPSPEILLGNIVLNMWFRALSHLSHAERGGQQMVSDQEEEECWMTEERRRGNVFWAKRVFHPIPV